MWREMIYPDRESKYRESTINNKQARMRLSVEIYFQFTRFHYFFQKFPLLLYLLFFFR